MQSPERRDYDGIETPDSNNRKRKFGVRRRTYGGGNSVENARDGRDISSNGGRVTAAFGHAKAHSAIGRQQELEFDFSGDATSANMCRDDLDDDGTQAAPKYMQVPRGSSIIKPGAAIMVDKPKKPRNEEELRLFKLREPDRNQLDFLNKIQAVGKTLRPVPAPRMRAMGLPAKRPVSSLEAASTPSAAAATTRTTTTPSSSSSTTVAAAAGKSPLTRDGWKAPARLKRDQESHRSEMPKRNRVELTPTPPRRLLLNKPRETATSNGAVRVSSRIQSRPARDTFGMYDSDDEKSKNATVARRFASRKSTDAGNSNRALTAFPLRRNTRASKEQNKEGTVDMPIQLADSDEDEEETASISQTRPDDISSTAAEDEETEAVERDDLKTGASRREFITNMEGYRVWFGDRACRLDFHLYNQCLWLRSLRGVRSKWPFDREYKIPYNKIKNVMVYRLDESQAADFDTSDPAGKVMATTSFIAFQFPIPDAMKKNEWREFYDPKSVRDIEAGEPISSKQFFIAVAKDDDKNGSILATLDDVFGERDIQIHTLSTLDDVRPFANALLANDKHYVFTKRPAAPTRETRRSRRRNDGDDDMDATQLTYPLPPCNMDVVTITRQDISRLQPAEYLNDNIIDYYLKRLLLEDFASNELLKRNVLFLSSHFYSRLRAGRGTTMKDRLLAGYKNVSTWLTRSDLFSRSLVFIPINKDLHWSLAVIINPKCAGGPEGLKDDPGPQTCVALLDPLGGYHQRAPIQRNLRSFLSFEWERVSKSDSYQTSAISAIEVAAPLQRNSYDCGVYVLKYAQAMLTNFARILATTENTTDGFLLPRDITDDGLVDLIAQDAFGAKDVTRKRLELQDLLTEDTKRYEAILDADN